MTRDDDDDPPPSYEDVRRTRKRAEARFHKDNWLVRCGTCFSLVVSLCGLTGFLVFYFMRDGRTPCDESEMLLQLNTLDREFFNEFNFRLWDWITWEGRTGSKGSPGDPRPSQEAFGKELEALIEAHQMKLLKFSGKSNLDEYRSEKAQFDVIFAIHKNKSIAKTWNKTEIYLETIAFQRIHRLQSFLVTSLLYPWHTSTTTFNSYLNYHDQEIDDIIRQLPKNLTSRANQFWTDIKLTMTPGIRYKCLVYNETAGEWNATATLERFAEAVRTKNRDCFRKGKGLISDEMWDCIGEVWKVVLRVLIFLFLFYCLAKAVIDKANEPDHDMDQPRGIRLATL